MANQRKLVMAYYKDIPCYICKNRNAQMWIRNGWGDRRYICVACESEFVRRYL